MKSVLIHTCIILLLLAGILGTAAYMEKVRPQDELVTYLYLLKGEEMRKFAFGFNGTYADILWTMSIQSFHKGFIYGSAFFRSDPLVEHYKDVPALARKLRDGEDPLSAYLRGQFSSSGRMLVDKHDDPEGLVALLRDNPDASYLRTCLSPRTDDLLDAYMGGKSSGDRNLAEKLRKSMLEDLRGVLCAELNGLIQRDDFQKPELFEKLFARLEIPEHTRELYRQRPKGKELLRLNRLLLEAAYPHEIRQSPYFENISGVFDFITDLDPHFQGVYQRAPQFLLIAEDPMSAVEMLEKGTKKEEIEDQPWIWYFLGNLYLNERFYLAKFREDDFRDLSSFVEKLRFARDPVSEYVRREFAPETLRMLESGADSEGLLPALVAELNRMVLDPELYNPERFSHLQLSKDVQRDIRKIEEVTFWSVVRKHLNRQLLEEAYPELEKIEQKATRLGLDALKKSVELGGGEEIRNMLVMLGKYDRFATMDIIESLRSYSVAKRENDSVLKEIALYRLHENILRVQMDFIQAQIEEFYRQRQQWPESLASLGTMPCEPAENLMESLADDLIHIYNNAGSDEQIHRDIDRYLQTWDRENTPYLYNAENAEALSSYQERQRLMTILDRVQEAIDDFYRFNQRLPGTQEFENIVKYMPKLPFDKRYRYADGKVSAVD